MSPDARPLLAPRARLREDRQTGRTLLLYPEAGLALNLTAAATLRLCDGERTLSQIAALLAERFGRETGEVAAEITPFLDQLVSRGLVREAAP
ncbi:pyrroloquinoline quinone biosynthesis peptide chaperone PqqD [Elioraea rosea]|uniref:pyrroloquinoline quinone biosynthesis peptide chaperone PqqD n=1 Tax=Elioraea rosea TaxID=2492390 RepID=UPI001315A0B6|nr:pyrroloquinoline quinone biosynthesis peptide chaperone PqqD [Elioraea rosea]